jgi:hypothetical protein
MSSTGSWYTTISAKSTSIDTLRWRFSAVALGAGTTFTMIPSADVGIVVLSNAQAVIARSRGTEAHTSPRRHAQSSGLTFIMAKDDRSLPRQQFQ